MKKIILLLALTFGFCVSNAVEAQEIKQDSVVNSWDLEDTAWYAWEYIDSVWMDSIYWQCLKNHKIKMNCSDCEYVSMHVDLNIDSTGMLAEYRINKSNVCGEEISERMEDEFMEFFKSLLFPEALRARTIHVILGTGLKC